MDGAPRPHRLLVRLLLGAATVLTVAAVFAVWANRQVLNADNWAQTSTAVLQNPAVKSQVATTLVDDLYSNVDVAGQLKTTLPPQLQPLAGPAAGGLRQAATQVTETLLGRPRVEQAWKNANRAAAQQFITIAEGKSKAVTTSGNTVYLNLQPIVLDLVHQLGLPGTLAAKVPPTAGQIKILQSNQVGSLQDAVSLVKGLGFVLPAVSLALFAAAVWLAAGRRRATLLWVGVDLCIAGAAVLVGRDLFGRYVVNTLVTSADVRPAAEAAWSIGTGMLRDVAQATIIGAIPVLLAAWLAGPARAAVAARGRLAPLLRDHEAGAYVVLGAVLLLVVAWGPIPATREVIPALLMAALAFLGLTLLRRQTQGELAAAAAPLAPPPAPSGDGERRTTVPAGDGP